MGGGRQCTVPELISNLRRYATGDVSIPVEYLLKPAQFTELEAYIDSQADGEPLKAFWIDKLRYEYETDTQVFRIVISDTAIHTLIAAAIREGVDKWLEELREHPEEIIRDCAQAIVWRGSTRIRFLMHNVRQTVEKAAGRESASARQADPALVESSYSPDGSWRFKYSDQIADEDPAIVYEVAYAQSPRDLYPKIDRYLNFCQTVTVITCRTDLPRSKGATLALWSRTNPEHPQQTSGEPYTRWDVSILDAAGEPVDNGPSAVMGVENFITRDSLEAFFHQYTPREVELLKYCPVYKIDTAALGRRLLDLREEEWRENERAEKKRKRAREVSPDASVEREAQPKQPRMVDAWMKDVEWRRSGH